MNVFEAVSKCDELKNIIDALELANSKLDSHDFTNQKRILVEVKQRYFRELKDLEDRMKDTQIKPVTNIR